MYNNSKTRFITIDEVVDRIPYSRAHIRRLIDKGKFPRSVAIGPSRVAWVESEIEAWMHQRIEQRGGEKADERRTRALKAVGSRRDRAASLEGGRDARQES